jgi:hypothetical protein
MVMCDVHMMLHVITLRMLMGHDYVSDNWLLAAFPSWHHKALFSPVGSFKIGALKSCSNPKRTKKVAIIMVLQLSSDNHRQRRLKEVFFYLLKLNLEFDCWQLTVLLTADRDYGESDPSQKSDQIFKRSGTGTPGPLSSSLVGLTSEVTRVPAIGVFSGCLM